MATTARTAKSSNGKRPTIIYRSEQDIRAEVDRCARKKLGITGEEFIRRMNAGELEYGPDEIALATLADLVR